MVWQRHVAELSDLAAAERAHLMAVVCAVERALIGLLRPDKINLASLGNVTPHLHWHVIPRWRDDSHFPAPVWAPPQRAATNNRKVSNAALAAALEAELSGVGRGPGG